MKPQTFLRTTLKKTLLKLGYGEFSDRELVLEKPRQEEFGDFAITIAMNLAKVAKKAPRKIAEEIVENLELDPHFVDKVEIAGPGFINFFLAKPCLHDTLKDILQDGDKYGLSDWGDKKVQFEFVSANPTGPLNIVSARAAAVGDVLAGLYEKVGFTVEREFYVNDAGRQVRLLGYSLSARYMSELGVEMSIPEGGYHGEYLRDLAKLILEEEGDTFKSMDDDERAELFSQKALEYMLNRQRNSLDKYNLVYDQWYRESTLREENAHLKVLKTLQDKGLTYEEDGAVWFKSSEFGDEKDRVLVTSQGEPTYFMVDIAYHQTKYDRGFELIYDFWGPDHHGYIDRMRGAMIALGHPADSFQVEIIQQVNLFRSGEVVKMSKRAGEIVEMDELIDEVGVDAARYFFIDRRISQPLDFDIDLAKSESDENPVYYVQYAHARICSVIQYAQEQGVELAVDPDLSVLETPTEMSLIRKLMDYPEVISKAAETLEPHRIPNYLHELSGYFHRFYHHNRVVTDDVPLTLARLALAFGARQVFQNGLDLLRISKPEKM